MDQKRVDDGWIWWFKDDNYPIFCYPMFYPMLVSGDNPCIIAIHKIRQLFLASSG